MLRSLFAVLAFALTTEPLWASKVKVWHHYQPSHFDKAQFKNVVVSNQGVLRLSRQLKPFANLDVAHIWDVVEDKAGNLFLATGDEGKIFKVTPDGKSTVVYTSKDAQILCLSLTPDGSLYAGTGPSGKIIKLDVATGKGTLVAEDLGMYVWSLAYDAQRRTLFAGTGPKGKIYQIAPDGKSSVFYATRQEHILSVALGADQTLYAGTDKGGLVYRIDAKGKGFVLYHAHQNEVRSLLVSDDVVYAGTSMPSAKRPTGPPKSVTPTIGPMSSGSGSNTTSTPPDGKAKTSTGSGGTFATEEPKGTPASAPSHPAVGDNSLYRIASDGSVREVFRDKTLFLRLLRLKGRILAATGMQGQLFEIDEATLERSEIARLDHGEIHCMLVRKDGSLVLGTGDPGKLYILEDRYAPKGTVVSDVLDAKIISVWGALQWKAALPAGTAVTMAVRSGNVPEADDTWSSWSAEQTDAEAAKAIAPRARYLQYRLTLSSSNGTETPEVRQVTVRYKTSNQSPEITSLDVPDLDAVNLDQPRKLKIKWAANDPNEDELTYSLYVRKEGWKDWVMLEEHLEKRDFEWDTTTTPSGMYQVKVVASDRRDNAPEDALSAEKISPLVPISQLPPTVTVRVSAIDAGHATIEATATDLFVRLTEATFTIDGKRWSQIFPTDGLFDSKTETFRFKTEALRPGAHVVVIRVRDAAGNLGSGDAVFSVPEKK